MLRTGERLAQLLLHADVQVDDPVAGRAHLAGELRRFCASHLLVHSNSVTVASRQVSVWQNGQTPNRAHASRKAESLP